MYIAYRVGRFIEEHKVSKCFAVYAQNDRDYNWSIVAKPFRTEQEAIEATIQIDGGKTKTVYNLGGYGVKFLENLEKTY